MSQDDSVSPAGAFEHLLAGMGPKLKRVLAVHRIPPMDAEDVLHQALVALLCQWDSIRDPEGWLLTTLRRHCLMYWRTRRRRLYSAVDASILEWLAQPQAPPQERCDLLADLRLMIGRLPPRCRTLLELRFQLGLEPAEAARRLGYRDSSMPKVTNRCLAALAREMLLAPANPPLVSPVPAGPLRGAVRAPAEIAENHAARAAAAPPSASAARSGAAAPPHCPLALRLR
jgi:RNA polymerase sigma-70 factor (ECF subfamily)